MKPLEATEASAPMDALEVILTRKSVRDFTEGDLPEADLLRILEAARWAPSAQNEQPWRFHILQGASKEAFASFLESDDAATLPMGSTQERSARSALGLADEGDPGEVAHLALRRKVASELRKVGAFIVACSDQPGNVTAALGVAAAIQNILLASHALGYGALWMRMDLIRRTIEEFLGIGSDEEVVSVVPIGFVSANPTVSLDRNRKELAEFVVYH